MPLSRFPLDRRAPQTRRGDISPPPFSTALARTKPIPAFVQRPPHLEHHSPSGISRCRSPAPHRSLQKNHPFRLLGFFGYPTGSAPPRPIPPPFFDKTPSASMTRNPPSQPPAISHSPAIESSLVKTNPNFCHPESVRRPERLYQAEPELGVASDSCRVKKQEHSRSELAIQEKASRQARLPESLIRKRQHRLPVRCPASPLFVYFRVFSWFPIRVYPCHPWLNLKKTPAAFSFRAFRSSALQPHTAHAESGALVFPPASYLRNQPTYHHAQKHDARRNSLGPPTTDASTAAQPQNPSLDHARSFRPLLPAAPISLMAAKREGGSPLPHLKFLKCQ